MARQHRPADEVRVGEHLADVLLPSPRSEVEGFDELPDPMTDLDAALKAIREGRASRPR